jgi:hypothetical protein
VSIIFDNIHGFSDLSDDLFLADVPAFGDMVQGIAENSEFAFENVEIFQAIYVHGDTVAIPISPIDGYQYAREELLYLWNPELSTSQATGWLPSGSGSLFFAAWNVDQATGAVYSLEWYRNNGSGGSRTQTNDGQIRVYTIAQRQRSSIFLSDGPPTYSAIGGGAIATDQPFNQTLAQGLNRNAKFATVNHEVFYCGEFHNGQTVPLSAIISPYDGYTYGYSEAKFQLCWRWTTDGTASAVTQPPEVYGQLGPFIGSVSSVGVVALDVKTNDNDGNVTFPTNYGRVAVFAFCTRSGTPSISPAATSLAELDFGTFVPDGTLRASKLLQVKHNIEESVLTPEFFGPTAYANGETIPTPTSAKDSYAYTRDELTYVWCWSDTTNFPTNGGRLPVFYGAIDQTTGIVTLATWRLASHYVDDHNELARINVIIVARRTAVVTADSLGAPPAPPTDATTTPAAVNPYAVAYDMGGGRTTLPLTGESMLAHVIPSSLTNVTFPAGLIGSAAGIRKVATSGYSVTINKNGSPIGSITYNAGAGTGTFSFGSDVICVPGDVIEFLGGTADATALGLYWTITGTRT